MANINTHVSTSNTEDSALLPPAFVRPIMVFVTPSSPTGVLNNREMNEQNANMSRWYKQMAAILHDQETTNNKFSEDTMRDLHLDIVTQLRRFKKVLERQLHEESQVTDEHRKRAENLMRMVVQLLDCLEPLVEKEQEAYAQGRVETELASELARILRVSE